MEGMKSITQMVVYLALGKSEDEGSKKIKEGGRAGRKEEEMELIHTIKPQPSFTSKGVFISSQTCVVLGWNCLPWS